MIDVKSRFKHPQLKRAGQAAALQKHPPSPEPGVPDWQADKPQHRACFENETRGTEPVFRRAGRYKGQNETHKQLKN